MIRKEFERVSPESVGIPSASVEWLLDRLEEGWTEPHGLMLMRFGKVFAEGWWAPYAAGLRHGLQSHTKTYAATAVGIAVTEGLLSLDDRVIDIFPDLAPEDTSENLKKLRVRHVLSMACGMEEMPGNTADWIREFLAEPVVHEPGTAFMYNSMGSTLLGAMVRRKTGLGLIDYLTPRLFDKIGIDAANLRCSRMPDGMEIGGGGLYATTEDNLRLLKLYADGGVWEGERILSEDYVRQAVSLQNESATERAVNPPAEDNFVGYGFQIWMCRPEGVYRADGAMGQFTIVFPKYDMILAITENASGGTGSAVPQRVLDTVWEWYYALPAPETKTLPEDGAAADRLRRRMSMLALPAPERSRMSPLQAKAAGTYVLREGKLAFKAFDFFGSEGDANDAARMKISFEPDSVVFDVLEKSGAERRIVAGMDGSRRENEVPGIASRALVSAKWTSDVRLAVDMRLVETAGSVFVEMEFAPDGTLRTGSGSGIAFVSGRRDRAVFEKEA